MTMLRGAALCLAALHAALGHDASHGDNTATVSSTDASAQHSILSSSVQDYLAQISQMQIENPQIAIPGQWLTDVQKTFVFLPIRIPRTLSLDEVKLLTDGRSLLVNVVERAQQAPEDASTKKFRLVLDAFKKEAAGNDKVMEDKLLEWESTEDDPKVRQLIGQSIAAVQHADGLHHHVPKALTIPLDGVELSELRSQIASRHTPKKAATLPNGLKIANIHGGTATLPLRSTYLQQTVKTSDDPNGGFGGYGGDEPNLITVPLNSQFLQQLETNADYVVPLKDKDAFSSLAGKASDQSYIKESFSVTLPYPTAPARIFGVFQHKGQIVLCMPYDKTGKASTVPFSRVPIFDEEGRKLTGPGTAAAELAPETREEIKETTKKLTAATATPRTGKKLRVPMAAVAMNKTKAPSKPDATPMKKLISIGDF